MKPGGHREKGKRAERALAQLLTAEGFPARRGVQYQGGPGSPDVVCEALPGIHWESKHCKRVYIYDWLAKAKRDAAPGQIPVIAYRQDHSPWVAVLALEDFLEILRGSEEVQQPYEPTLRDAAEVVCGAGAVFEGVEVREP